VKESSLLVLAIAAASLAVGCGGSAGYYRPGGERLVGRSGLVGERVKGPAGTAAVVAAGRVAPGRADEPAQVVVYFSFANRGKERLTFLPAGARLAAASGRLYAPRRAEEVRASRDLALGEWQRGDRAAVFDLAPGDRPDGAGFSVTWEYMAGARRVARRTAFVPLDPRRVRYPPSAIEAGMVTENRFRSESGVPVLMDIPFAGILFRSSTTSTTTASTRGFGRGDDWPGGHWEPVEIGVDRY